MLGYDRILMKQNLYQKIETLVIPQRTEASIFIPISIQSEQLVHFLHTHNLKLFTWIIYACLETVKTYPELHQFVMGHRLYQHRFYTLSTLIKKDKNVEGSNHSVKLNFLASDTPVDIQEKLNASIHTVQNKNQGNSSQLFKLLGSLPVFFFKLMLWCAQKLNEFDLLPNSIIQSDPLHSAVMIANLGSIHGQSVFHHLFNWGTTSIFISFGRLSEHGHLELSFTIDERIGEGLIFFKALNHFKHMLEAPDVYYS